MDTKGLLIRLNRQKCKVNLINRTEQTKKNKLEREFTTVNKQC